MSDLSLNKESERSELFKTIWDIACKLRGSVDGWDFKQYILGMLFYRYLSENLTNYVNKHERGRDPNFDYAAFTGEVPENVKEALLEEKGFFMPPEALFCNVVKNKKDDENLNERLANIFKEIEASINGTPAEKNIKGLFANLDVNSPILGATVKIRNDKLREILNAIAGMELGGKYENNNIDVFGDAYEYLMGMYAGAAGKSGGEFFTPQEVSELLAKIVGRNQKSVHKVYDPCCGSGSLLLKLAKVLNPEGDQRLEFYGQEINLTTYNLCRINMFLHNVPYHRFHIAHGDTLLEPVKWDDQCLDWDNGPFDAIVANPPFSLHWKGAQDPTLINDPRFSPAGYLAPKGQADFAFVMHMLAYLRASGTCAIVLFPGVLYRGGAEKKIREYLITHNFIDCVIALPPDLFFGTNIATCILVLKKNKTDTTTLFIDASACFVKDGKKNKLGEENINKILEAYSAREERAHFSAAVCLEEIQKNEYNLSVNRYVEPEDKREAVDIAALNQEIAEIVERQAVLRRDLDAVIMELEEGRGEG